MLHRAAIPLRYIAAGELHVNIVIKLSEPDMRLVVLALSRSDLFKSMTTHANHREWQDVYHGATEERREGKSARSKAGRFMNRPYVKRGISECNFLTPPTQVITM